MKLLYRIVRPLARIALKTYFKKIYLSGLEKLPLDKPVILAANHPSAFLEPCILATTLPRPLHFMVRGDLFQKKIYRILLMSLHMIPMYRKKDIGFSGVRNNFSSLDYTYDLLHKNKLILILAEGTTKHEKRLRPIQKGAARMALGAIKKYPHLDVQIVPIGVNYTDIISYRSDVMLEIGDPLSVRDYLKEKVVHPAKLIETLTAQLAAQLKELVVIIDKKEDEPLVESIFSLYRNNYPEPKFPIQSASNRPLQRERKIANDTGRLSVEVKQNLQKMIDHYQSGLAENQLTDAVIVQPNQYHPFNHLILIAGFIPFLIGYFTNILPVRQGKLLADTRVKKIEFYASVSASASLAAYLLYIFLLFIPAFILKSLFYLIFVIMIPFFGFFALHFYEYYQRYKAERQFYFTDVLLINKFKQERKSILRYLEQSWMDT